MEEDPVRRSGELDQAKSVIATSISLLEHHSKVSEAASLYLKIGRSLDRSLGRVLAARSSGFGQGSEVISGNYSPLLQNRSVQYRWPEQQSGVQLQPADAFGGSSSGLRPANISEPSKYFTFSGEQEPGLYNTEPLSYLHAGAVSNWQSPGFGMDESIDPSLLEPSQGFPQQERKQ